VLFRSHIDVPLYIIFYLENLNEKIVNIDIEIFNLGKIVKKVYNNFDDIKYKKLSELIYNSELYLII